MREGEGRLGVDDLGECLGDAIESRIVDRTGAICRLERDYLLLHVGGDDARPEVAIAAPADHRVDQRRIEPATTTILEDAQRLIAPAAREEDLGGLRDVEDAREEGDLVAALPRRIAVAVPVFVERADRADRLLGKGESLGDVGAALAARGDQFLRHALLARDAEEVPHARVERRLEPGVAPGLEGERHLLVPVHDLHVRLDHLVVRAEEGSGARRVGRAAGVLEEEGVVERGQPFVVEAEFLSEAHADHAGAYRVSERLPFGEVERAREGRHHLRHGDASGRLAVAQRGR